MMMDSIPRLTDGQRDCLRLVYKHMTSKDIARELGVSPHTVDMRLRTAMRVLAVASRIDAARLLIASEALHGGASDGAMLGLPSDFDVAAATASHDIDAPAPYQPLIYHPSDVAAAPEKAIVGGPASTPSDEHAIHDFDPRIRPVVGSPASGPPRLAGASNLFTAASFAAGSSATEWRNAGDGTAFPSAMPWGKRNDLSVGTRLVWILVIAIGSALAFGAILAALAALKTLI
jgi:DNA-binding CsgD family transcriptional regulator